LAEDILLLRVMRKAPAFSPPAQHVVLVADGATARPTPSPASPLTLAWSFNLKLVANVLSPARSAQCETGGQTLYWAKHQGISIMTGLAGPPLLMLPQWHRPGALQQLPREALSRP